MSPLPFTFTWLLVSVISGDLTLLCPLEMWLPAMWLLLVDHSWSRTYHDQQLLNECQFWSTCRSAKLSRAHRSLCSLLRENWFYFYVLYNKHIQDFLCHMWHTEFRYKLAQFESNTVVPARASRTTWSKMSWTLTSEGKAGLALFCPQSCSLT